MSWLSSIGDALGGYLGYPTFGADAGDALAGIGSAVGLGTVVKDPKGGTQTGDGSFQFDTDVLGAILGGATSLGAQYYGDKATADATRQKALFELEKEKLAYQYGLKGGKGGGGGSDIARKQLLVTAYNNYLTGQQSSRNAQQSALNTLIQGSQNALLRR